MARVRIGDGKTMAECIGGLLDVQRMIQRLSSKPSISKHVEASVPSRHINFKRNLWSDQSTHLAMFRGRFGGRNRALVMLKS